MSFLRAQSALLRRRPLVVGTLTGTGDLRSQLRRAASPLVDVVELRLDTFPDIYRPNADVFAKSLIETVRRLGKKPVLLTLRSYTERGQAAPARERLSDSRREALVAPLLSRSALIDVETRRSGFARRVGALAKKAGVTVIHSYHDFKGARLSGLDRRARRARAAGADIFKVAVTPRGPGELEAFLTWGQSLSTASVLIGMGPASAISRLVGFTFGSVLTFGHLGRSAAPGQMAAADLGRAVRRIYGRGT